MSNRAFIQLFLLFLGYTTCAAQVNNKRLNTNKNNGTYRVNIGPKMVRDSVYFDLGTKLFDLSDSCKHIISGVLKIDGRKYKVYDSTDFDEYGNNFFMELRKGVYSFKIKCRGYYPVTIPQYYYYPGTTYIYSFYLIKKGRIRRQRM